MNKKVVRLDTTKDKKLSIVFSNEECQVELLQIKGKTAALLVKANSDVRILIVEKE